MPKALCPNKRVFFLFLSHLVVLSLYPCPSSDRTSFWLSLSLTHSLIHLFTLTLTLYFFPPATSLTSFPRVFLLSDLVNVGLGYNKKQHRGHQKLVTNPYTERRSIGR